MTTFRTEKFARVAVNRTTFLDGLAAEFGHDWRRLAPVALPATDAAC
jgi:hypothetical protein